MTAQKNPMQPLYDKLTEAGFKKSLISKLLPDWWCDEVASTPSGYQAAALRFAKLFSIRYSSLINEGPAEFSLAGRCFKRQCHIDEKSLDQASALASLSARLTLRAFDRNFDSGRLNAADIRSHLLDRGLPWIDFKALVDYCWELGIPVIFASSLPSPKMQGLALKINGRPAIVLTSGRKHGYLVFDLAHELGHIAYGHVSDDDWIIDKKIDAHARSDGSHIDIEAEANQFALELLTGNGNTKFKSNTRLNGKQLAQHALEYGRANMIDPMHIVLNYAFIQGVMPIGNNAITELVRLLGIKETDQDTCQAAFLRYVDIESLDDEESALRQLIGAAIA